MYYLVYGIFWLLSRLPLRVLYFISDAIYGLVFYILKYRKKVVLANLQIAFPEKSEKERIRIARKFYHNLVDTFVETIKMMTVSEKFLEKRCSADFEVVNQLKVKGRPVQIHIGHNFNWEWANTVASKRFNLPILVVYMPLASKVFEKLFYKLRSKSGNKLIRATQMGRDMVPYRKMQYILGLVADQNPGAPSNAWWFEFFGRPTPFVKGPARGATANNTPVVFAYIHKTGRGRYKGSMTVATMEPRELGEEELTRRFVRYLENVIREYPEMWLWSHRRWKHEWKPEYGPVLK